MDQAVPDHYYFLNLPPATPGKLEFGTIVWYNFLKLYRAITYNVVALFIDQVVPDPYLQGSQNLVLDPDCE